MNKKKIIVTDLETISADANTTSPLQISALAIDPFTLNIIKNSEFNSFCRPDEMDDPEFMTKYGDTMKWHANNQKVSVEEFVAKINAAPPESIVWANYVKYLEGYRDNSGKGMSSAPIMAGYNIIKFDEPIMKRLCAKYGNVFKNEPNIFYWRDSLDLMKIIDLWFRDLDLLKDYKMDTVRAFFNMSAENAHDGIKDCRDEAELLIKFLRLHRNQAQKIKWKSE